MSGFDGSNIGPDKTYKSAIDEIEKQNGTYVDRVEKVSPETTAPTGLPQGPDPMPFKIDGGGLGQ